MFLLLTLVISTVGYTYLRRLAEEGRQELLERQFAIATTKAQLIEAWLNDRILDATQIRESLGIAGQVDLTSLSAEAERIRRYLDVARLTSAERMGISIYASDGRLVVGTGETVEPPGRVREILATALTSPKPQIFESPDLDAPPLRYRVHFLVPLGSGDSRNPAVAILVLTIDPQPGIFERVREWHMSSRSSEVLVVRKIGDQVIFLSAPRHHDPASRWLRIALQDREVPAVQAVLKGEGALTGTDYRGVSVLAAFHPVGGVPWRVVAKTDVDEAISATRQQADLVSFIIGLALVTAGLFTAYLWREQRLSYLKHQRMQLEERVAITRHYEQLIRLARDIILLIDPAGNIVEFNESALAAYGYGAEEMRGKNIRELRTLEAAQTFARDWQSAGLATGVLFETVHRRKDGTAFPVEVSSRVIDIDGKPYRQSSVRIVSERKRLEESLLRMTRVLSSLQMAKGVLLKAQSEDELFQDMCDIIVSVGGYRMAGVGIAEQDEEKTVRFVAVSGTNDGYLEKAQITWGDGVGGSGPTGTAIRSGEVQVNQNFQTNERMAPWREAARERGFQASISLPLREPGRVFGTLTIYAAQPDAFSADEVNLLGAFADDISYGVGALRTRTKADATAAQLRDSMEKTIGVLAEAVEVRDPYTAGHQSRVAQLARAIALELRLPAETVQGVYFGGLIHDVGKISIPAEILSKPGKLTKIEFELIKQHPKVGADIIKSVSFPWPVADMIAQHHERIDGSGYPVGLKGDAICLEGRILAVADVIEAMMSHRPYRPGLGIERALQEIDRGRGTSYDPAAVDACAALFKSGGFAFAEKETARAAS